MSTGIQHQTTRNICQTMYACLLLVIVVIVVVVVVSTYLPTRTSGRYCKIHVPKTPNIRYTSTLYMHVYIYTISF